MRVRWTRPALKDLDVMEDEIQIHEVHNSAKMIRHFNSGLT